MVIQYSYYNASLFSQDLGRAPMMVDYESSESGSGMDEDVYSDDGYGEHEVSRAAPEKKLPSPDTSKLFTVLSKLTPDHFVMKAYGVRWFQQYMDPSTSVPSTSGDPLPVLKVDPDLSGTWFAPPLKQATDTVGTWPSAARLPPNPIRCAPPIFGGDPVLKMPARIKDFTIVNTNLERMLNAPKLGKLCLEPDIFGSFQWDVTSNHLSSIDLMLRTSLQDGFITEALLKPLLLILDSLKTEEDLGKIRETFSTLQQTLALVAGSQCRQQHYVTAAFVANKFALRLAVMGKLTVPFATQQPLKGSTFMGPDLFGPFPESFQTSVASHGYSYRCYSKQSSASTSEGRDRGSLPGPSSFPSPSPSVPVSPSGTTKPFRGSSVHSKVQKPGFPRGRGKGKSKGS